MKRAYAYSLISGAEMSAMADMPVTNERQARALRKVPEEQRVEVMERVQETGRPITAAIIEEVARTTEPQAKCKHCEIHCPIRYTR